METAHVHENGKRIRSPGRYLMEFFSGYRGIRNSISLVSRDDDNGQYTPLKEELVRLANYPPGNKIPYMGLFRIVRIPSFLMTGLFFSCAGWFSMSDRFSTYPAHGSDNMSNMPRESMNSIGDSFSSISSFIDFSTSGGMRLDFSHYPATWIQTLMGFSLAAIYSAAILHRGERYLRRQFRNDYMVYVRNAIRSVETDPEKKSAVLIIYRNYIPTFLFLDMKNGGVIPVMINTGLLGRENEKEGKSVYQPHTPLVEGEPCCMRLFNEYGKCHDTLNLVMKEGRILMTSPYRNLDGALTLNGKHEIQERKITYEES